VIEVADIFRQHAAAYQSTHRLSTSQRRALRDLEHCRTAFFGGELTQCNHCERLHYAYHSCKNRHCPKCHGQQTADWLTSQEERLLPGPYYLVTFTLPDPLRRLAKLHAKILYGVLLKCAADALLKLTADPRYWGATPAILAVLHTWTRAMLYHPHAHLLVSAGGWDPSSQQWRAARQPAFLVPVRALSVLFRAKIRAALKTAKLAHLVPAQVWSDNWVVHCQHAGTGQKVLDYLARYLFRVAISNSRLKAFADGLVTFGYTDNRTHQPRQVTLAAEQFISRFLLHILPPGFHKVRYYGLASAAQSRTLQQARNCLAPATVSTGTPLPSPAPANSEAAQFMPCPYCHTGRLIFIQTLRPQRKVPP
jgi:hypothetical protein